MSGEPKDKKMRPDSTEKIGVNDKKLIDAKNEDAEDDDVIFLPYDVVSLIFKNLLGKDLCNCAMVCTMWQEAASNELSKRGIVVRNLNTEQVFRNCDTVEFPNDLPIKPMFGLLFTTSQSRPRDCYAKHFPQKCFSLVMNTFGNILNNHEYVGNTEVGVCGYFPESPGVQIEFMIGCKNSRLLHYNKNLEILNKPHELNRLSFVESIFLGAIERLKGIKCMLLITTDSFKYEYKLSGMKAVRENVDSLWGGVVRKLTICKRDSDGISHTDDALWAAILIAGTDVKSWSIVIDRDMVTREVIRNRLLRMRKSVKFYKHTVGLMLACVERGEKFWGSPNVESTIFKEVFPEVPLIGAFGNGEFGINFDDKKPHETGSYSYATSFMIITYR